MKWLAIGTMTIDHVGAVLAPQHDVLRYIGRLAFPLFAYLLVWGVESTRNIKNYFMRLVLFALLSQVPFFLAFGMQPWEHWNIFFTLASGVGFIYYYKKNNPLWFVPLVASALVPFDFGIYGVMMIGCFYVLRSNRTLGGLLFFMLNLLFLAISPVQVFALLALPLVLLHNAGKLGGIERGERVEYPRWKQYFFYVYYPLHLLVLYSLKVGI